MVQVKKYSLYLVSCGMGAIWILNGALAQESKSDRNPLGTRQQQVARMMQDLEMRFRTISRSLREKEPERAAKLLKAFEESKRLLIERRMAETAALLEAAKLEDAGDRQQELIKDLKALVSLLLDEEATTEAERQEIDRLKQWRETLQTLIRDEEQQERTSDRLARPTEVKQELFQGTVAIKQLVESEEKLMEQTAKVRQRGIDGLAELAEQQKSIRAATDVVLRQLTSAADTAARSSEHRSVVPGQQPLEDALRSERTVEKELTAGKGRGAQDAQVQVVKALTRALEELAETRAELDALSPEAFQELANQQESLADTAEVLGQGMAQAAQPGNAEDETDQAARTTAATCQRSVGQAQKAMQLAAEQLRDKVAAKANQSQQVALKELSQALQAIEERLGQLGADLQQDARQRLQEIFAKMLERQQVATKQTAALDEKQSENGGQWKRSDRVALRKVVTEEKALAKEAQRALRLLEEEGTSIVFPSVVANLAENLLTVATLIEAKRTGSFTHALQLELEQTLLELLDALDQAQRNQRDRGDAGESSESGKGEQGKTPLLPSTAELKMLRALQLRVNRRTQALDQNRQADHELDKLMEEQLTKISELQAQIRDLVGEILQRQR